MTSTGTNWWVHGLTRECVQFQVDISCLVDGELDEVAGGRAIAHLEDCCPCRDFFEDARQQVRAHRDMADPDRLVRRYADLLGVDVADEIESIELVANPSTTIYQPRKS